MTRRVREIGVQSGLGGALPIIGASGNEGQSHNELALAAGQNLIWGKPLPMDAQLQSDLRRLVTVTGGPKG